MYKPQPHETNCNKHQDEAAPWGKQTTPPQIDVMIVVVVAGMLVVPLWPGIWENLQRWSISTWTCPCRTCSWTPDHDDDDDDGWWNIKIISYLIHFNFVASYGREPRSRSNKGWYHHQIKSLITNHHCITWTDGEAKTEKTIVVNKLTPAVMKKSQRHSDKLLSS